MWTRDKYKKYGYLKSKAVLIHILEFSVGFCFCSGLCLSFTTPDIQHSAQNRKEFKMDRIFAHLLKPTKEKSSGSLFFFLSRIGCQVYVLFSILLQLSNGLTFPLTCTESQDSRLAKNFVTMHCSNKALLSMDGKSQEIKYHR